MLASIVVANNLIEILPPGLAGCSSLTMLDLQGNKMREIAQGSLPASLTELNLCRNRLEVGENSQNLCLGGMQE